MAIFYKGIPVGTFWHLHDPASVGFTPRSPMAAHHLDRIINHVGRAQTVSSPYVSLTLSFSVAWIYANTALSATPGFIYEIELNDPLPLGATLLDPVKELAAAVLSPLVLVGSNPYQHDGYPDLLVGLVGTRRSRLIHRVIKQPPGNPPRSAYISPALETFVRALRDAEMLVFGSIPASCIKQKYVAS